MSSGTDSEQNSEHFERDQLSPESEFEFTRSDDLATHGISEIHFDDGDFDQAMQDIEEPPPPAVSMHQSHPPLENDEREFSQTAGAMRQRKESEQAESRRASRPSSTGPDDSENAIAASPHEQHPCPQIHEEPESIDDYDQQQRDATILFGSQPHPTFHQFGDFTASPMLKPEQAPLSTVGSMGNPAPKKHIHAMSMDSVFAWSDLKSPENMELAELDDLLGGY